ncbi:MAG: hypothetical protein M0C28_41250 [Candidatus Moduliflexus flocculans]|nr:hypothetical protein [Candidatus Moduliflexus flocculans]
MKENATIDNTANYGRAPITPVGAYELRVADKPSRDMLFTALCEVSASRRRSRPPPASRSYYFNGKWNDVWFEKGPETGTERATLILQNDPKNRVKPEYYIHFTAEELKEGFYRTLDYEYDPQVKNFPCSLQVIPGSYLASYRQPHSA